MNDNGWLWWRNDIWGPWGVKLPDICLTGEENPRKNLTQETCPDRGSNLVPLRDRRACYHLSHCGGRHCIELNISLEEFGLAKVFDQSTIIHKTEHLVHGCANHETEGKLLKSPVHCCDVTKPPYLFSGELCTSPLHCNSCLCTPCAVGAPGSASLCSEHVNQKSYRGSGRQ